MGRERSKPAAPKLETDTQKICGDRAETESEVLGKEGGRGRVELRERERDMRTEAVLRQLEKSDYEPSVGWY